MKVINEQLEKAIKVLSEEKYLQLQVTRIKSAIEAQEVRLVELSQQLEKEEKDVEKLTKFTLSAFVHTLLKDMDERLEKEREEAFEAKLRLDKEISLLNKYRNDLKQYEVRLTNLAHVKDEYDELIKQKKAIIDVSKPEIIELYDRYQESIEIIEDELFELSEALVIGEQVLCTVSQVIDELESAKSWGSFDMLGGGMLATLAKRNHMDEAQQLIHELVHQLSGFSRELKAVEADDLIDTEFTTYFGVADYFLDGFFVDFAVQSQINYMLTKVMHLNEHLLALVKTMKLEKKRLMVEIDQKHEDARRLIETA